MAFLLAVWASGAQAAAVCPAGTRAYQGKCVKDAAAGWAVPSFPAAAVQPPPSKDGARRPPAGEAACRAFAADLEAFHSAQASEFSAQGRGHLRLEESLAAEAAAARDLSEDLTRQSRHARQSAIRRHLAAQAREAGQAAAAAEKRLKETVKMHREDEERFKDLYKIRARMLLERRPAGCPVK
ncbi:hypothetical protein EPO15_01415 [bacterium]|nr:MAG: hypothetical protein EPO15_01415 [bacterium]